MSIGNGKESKSSGAHAVVVAAGKSTRMLGVDKMLVTVLGRPLLSHSLQALSECHRVDEIVVVVSSRILVDVKRLVEENGWGKVTDVVEGGLRRQDSVRSGLECVDGAEWVIVHDAARPCVGPKIFEQAIDAAQETGAAVAGVPVSDTIKLTDGNMIVNNTLPRQNVWLVQTPQAFRTDMLVKAHDHVSVDVTDDSSMVEIMGEEVKIFHGLYSNIKVTTPTDLHVIESVLQAQSEEKEV